jgi:hypothetical protein
MIGENERLIGPFTVARERYERLQKHHQPPISRRVKQSIKSFLKNLKT